MTQIAGLTPEEARFILQTVRQIRSAGLIDAGYERRLTRKLPRNVDDGLGDIRFFVLIGDVRQGSALARVCDRTGTPFSVTSPAVQVNEMFGYVRNALANYYGLFIKLDGVWRFAQGPCIDTSCVVGASHITQGTVPTGTVNEAYTHTITFSGLTENPRAIGLPPGLSFARSTGVISGTPTTPGVYDVVISGTSDPNNCAITTAFQITIDVCDVGASFINPDDPPDATIDVPYSHSILYGTLAANPTINNLPTGLSFNGATGEISGTPTVAGTWLVTVSGTSSVNSCSIFVEFLLTVPPCDIEEATLFNPYGGDDLPPATQNSPYFARIGFNDLTMPIELLSSLPTGLVWNGSVGTIAGTPTVCNDFELTFRATTQPNGCKLHLKVNLTVLCGCPEPWDYTGLGGWIVTSGTNPSNETISHNIPFNDVLSTNNAAFNLSEPLVSTLPPGLTWDPVAGEIDGIPDTIGVYSTTFYGTITTGTHAGCPVIHTRIYTVS